jgi:AcrR family transcriptional regulator
MTDRHASTDEKLPAASTDRRGQRHTAKRARIINNAWSLARRDGLAGISLRDLADSVDLRQPSLYAYFESKLDLYDAMFEDGQQQLLDRCLAREPLADAREELVAIVEDLVRFSSEDIVRHQLLFQRTIPGFEPSAAAMETAQQFVDLMAERLRAARVDGPGDVDLFSAIVSGLAHQQVANDPGGDRWVGLARRVVVMLVADIDRRSDRPSNAQQATTQQATTQTSND